MSTHAHTSSTAATPPATTCDRITEDDMTDAADELGVDLDAVPCAECGSHAHCTRECDDECTL